MARIRISSAQQLYVAFYGRPGDPGGLAFWDTQVNGNGAGQTNYAGIADAFGNSPEAIARFGSLSFSDAVNTLFNSILGRDADPAGLNFFVGELNAGRITLAGLALAIVEGIEEGSIDAATFNNKVLTANRFTMALDTPQELALYDFQRNPKSLQIALDLLDNVTSNPATVPTPASVQQTINSLAPTGMNSSPQIIGEPFLRDDIAIVFTAVDTDSPNLTVRIGDIPIGIANNGTETVFSIVPQSRPLIGRLSVSDGINSTLIGSESNRLLFRPFAIGTNDADGFANINNENSGIYGFGGDDVIIGGSGNDFIFGGSGNDELFGRSGIDLIVGEEGNDELFGEADNDLIFGGDGDDLISGGNGDDIISGEDGDDVIDGEFGSDNLAGGSGDDVFGFTRIAFDFIPTSILDRAILVGGDIINDFEGAGLVGGDIIALSGSIFEIESTSFFFGNTFASVENDSLADLSNSKITFSRSTGNLFYNDSTILSDSVVLATLIGVNNLTVNDFEILV